MRGLFLTFSVLVLVFIPFGLKAEGLPKPIDSFLAENCFECHDDEVSKGDLNLLDLNFDFKDPHNFEIWEKIFVRTESGEMPPEKKPRPDQDQLTSFLSNLEKPLNDVIKEIIKTEGRVKVRRLTRLEYERTLHDLLGVDIPLVDVLPEDSSLHGIETVASVQQLSQHLLGRYLEAAEIALTEAVKRATSGDKAFTKLVDAGMLGRKSWKSGNYRGPEDREGRAIAWNLPLQFYGRMPATSVPASGWYRITVKDVQAINAGVVWGTLRSGTCSSNSPMLYSIGLVEATKEKRDLSYDAWIEKGHMLELKPNDATIPRPKIASKGGTVSYKGSNLVKDGAQGIAMGGIELTRIFPNGNAKKVREALLGKVTLPQIETATPEERKVIVGEAVHRFADRAFRRPVTKEIAKPYQDLAVSILEEKTSQPLDALFTAYRAILCSPRFLTFYEKPGKLDQHALASRLSYMLWNSMPDEKLRSLADQGELKGPVVHEQLSRMINDPKTERFIESFTDQWLKLKEIDFTSPDARLFRTFDPVVQDSMLAETRGFFGQILRTNGHISNLIQSDFGMLNERLARFYSMDGLDIKPGEGLQKVSLKTNQRSGLITQGAILKVTADGTSTSPIIRGIYVAERILGIEVPPPPPGIPAVEPDIRGAVSIRDKLEKHSTDQSCAACHKKIDPAGFALENFDPVGLWRTQYGTKKTSAKVDPSGTTPDGKTFADIQEWKQVYLNQPDQLVEAFAGQLITYATGAPPGFADRAALKKIVEANREKDYGMRSLMHAVVASEPFQIK